MLKKRSLRWILFFMLLSSTILELKAQSGRYYGGCKIWKQGEGWVEVPCNTSGSSGQPFSWSSPVGSGIYGAFGGALIGSLFTDNYGKNEWGTGAALGSGFFMALSLVKSARYWSPLKRYSVAAISGALLGGGIAKASKAKADTNLVHHDNTWKGVGIGAAGVLATMITVDVVKKIGHMENVFYMNHKPSFLSNTDLCFSGERIVLRWRF